MTSEGRSDDAAAAAADDNGICPSRDPDDRGITVLLGRYNRRKIRLPDTKIFSLDYPVPSAVRNSVQAKYRDPSLDIHDEFSHIRYTAAIHQPNEFTLRNGYSLSPAMYNRYTELLVGITYYNEDKVLLSRTLHSVMKNVRDICNLPKSEFWNKGSPAWQKIVVCLLLDGVAPCDLDVLDVLATVGVYQDGVMKKDVDGTPTVAHIFEYTTQLSITPDHALIRPVSQDSIPPVQLMLCFKTHNSGKINSHRWLMGAFGQILNPEVIVTVDVGTELRSKALLNLWEAFYNDSHIAGACAELECNTGRFWKAALNPLVAAQNFEYKAVCQLDRALEASLGYITVLPGAFSAYRFRAIIGRPLDQYFRGDPTLANVLGPKGTEGFGAMRSNMFLAEDRILCFEAVGKEGSKWHLGHVGAAVGETDNPTTMADFIIQRRRWLNGAFASTVYSITHFFRIYRSGHNVLRMMLLHVQLIYNIVSLLLSWFGLAAFLLALFIVNDIAAEPAVNSPADGFPFGSSTRIVNAVIQVVYASTIVLQFVLALGSRPKNQFVGYLVSFTIFGIINLYFLVNVVYLAKRVIDYRFLNNGSDHYVYINEFYTNVGQLTVTVTACSVFGVYWVAGLLCLDPWHLFTCYAQYIFVASSYTNILNIYAFSNSHDISWGNKQGREEDPAVWSQPSARTHETNGGAVVEEQCPIHEDLDGRFESTVIRALAPYRAPSSSSSSGAKESFNDRMTIFRTRLLAAYIFSNFFLCIFVLNDSFKQLHFLGDAYWHKIWFFRIWMWANSGCFLMRLGGCVYHRSTGLFRYLFARR